MEGFAEFPKANIMSRESESLLALAIHEFRAPLARMRFALAKAGLCCQPDTEALDAMQREITRMEAMVRRFILLAGPETDDDPPESVSLAVGEMLFELVERNRDLAVEHFVRLEREETAAGLSVRSDPFLLERILDNLLQNAILYSGRGSTVRMEAEAGENEVVITVRDDGPGIPPERLVDLTKPFCRGDRARELGVVGSGLGLALAKRLAERLGVRLLLENSSPSGLAASIHFPLK